MSQSIIGDRFEMGDLIGQGGMGSVYRGIDRQTGKTIAIKALRNDIGDITTTVIERFEREAEALRRLNHPNIVQIVATVDEGGRHYLILEYVEGGSLAQLLQHQPQMPIKQVVQIALDIADALTRAHRLKIIHRDIKPHNVLIADDGTPRLTDFGVAHLDDRTRLTQSGSMVGTYAYLSPEGCHGEDLDERADIWSFGVMLFEMLAGQRPFGGANPGATITAVLSKPTPDLSLLRPDVPPRMVALINSMLQKDRDTRISSVRMVGAELEAILRGDSATPSNQPGVTRVLVPREDSRFSTPITPVGSAQNTPTSGSETRVLQTALTDAGVVSPIAEPTAPTRAKPTALTILALVAVIVIGSSVLLLGHNGNGSHVAAPTVSAVSLDLAAAVTASPMAATATAAPTVAPTPSPLRVKPVAEGEYMALVARIEPLSDGTDPTRFVIDNLTQALEEEVPFTHIKVREYPQVINSAAAAQAAAADNNAPIVIWGNYDPSGVELNVAIGVTNAFTHIGIERAILERTANVRVHLTDARKESAAVPVLVALNVLRNADGNAYELLRTVASLEELKATRAEVPGNSVSARVNRFFLAYFNDTPQAIKEIDAAISLDPNPLLYTYRSAVRMRAGRVDEALSDMETARRTGPAGWTSPLTFLGGTKAIVGRANAETMAQSMEMYNQVVAQQPNDWFALSSRGFLYYMLGDLAAARADQERAILRDPDINMPYISSALIALHEARLADAATLIKEASTRFPNPTFGMRVFSAFYGDKVPNFFGPLQAAFGSLMVGQYAETVAYTDIALTVDNRLSDAHFLRGFAQCNLGQPAEAEASYSHALELAPNFSLLHLLRAEVRASQKNLQGAQEDVAAAASGSQAAALADSIVAAKAGKLSCKSLFAPH